MGGQASNRQTDSDSSLPDEFNTFYCSFDTSLVSLPYSPSSSVPAMSQFLITEHEVRNLLRRQNSRKAAGPDFIIPVCETL